MAAFFCCSRFCDRKEEENNQLKQDDREKRKNETKTQNEQFETISERNKNKDLIGISPENEKISSLNKIPIRPKYPSDYIPEHSSFPYINVKSLNPHNLDKKQYSFANDLLHQMSGKVRTNENNDIDTEANQNNNLCKKDNFNDKRRCHKEYLNSGPKRKQKNNSVNFNSSRFYNNYIQEKDEKILNGEKKIIKRVNKEDYDNNAYYGKPSEIYMSDHLFLSRGMVPMNQNEGRTFKKFASRKNEYNTISNNNSNNNTIANSNNNNNTITNSNINSNKVNLYSCENCKEIYKLLIMNKKELKPFKCIECGNILNHQSYQYYSKQFRNGIYNYDKDNNNRKFNNAIRGKSIDEGKFDANWKKWNDVKHEERKENLAYDIISGKSYIDLSKSNDVKLKNYVDNARNKINQSKAHFKK